MFQDMLIRMPSSYSPNNWVQKECCGCMSCGLNEMFRTEIMRHYLDLSLLCFHHYFCQTDKHLHLGCTQCIFLNLSLELSRVQKGPTVYFQCIIHWMRRLITNIKIWLHFPTFDEYPPLTSSLQSIKCPCMSPIYKISKMKKSRRKIQFILNFHLIYWTRLWDMTIVDDDVCAWGESRLDINWISSSDTKKVIVWSIICVLKCFYRSEVKRVCCVERFPETPLHCLCVRGERWDRIVVVTELTQISHLWLTSSVKYILLTTVL